MRTDAMPANAVSVYYPFGLVELLAYAESDDYEGSGEVLLSFRDRDGCKVTIRVSRIALAQLVRRLQSAPDRA